MRKIVLPLLSLLALAAPALACESVTSGDLTLRNAWSRPTVGAQQPGVVYLEIINRGSTDDALTGLSTPAATMPMLHRTVIENGVASMPHVMRIEVPAGQTVQLAPNGYHGMLMGLSAPLRAGDKIPLSLQFERAGEVAIEAEVLAPQADPPVCDTP